MRPSSGPGRPALENPEGVPAQVSRFPLNAPGRRGRAASRMIRTSSGGADAALREHEGVRRADEARLGLAPTKARDCRPRILASPLRPQGPGRGLSYKGSLWGAGATTRRPHHRLQRVGAKARALGRAIGLSNVLAGGSHPQGSLTGRRRREKRCAPNPVRVPGKRPGARSHRSRLSSGCWAMDHVRRVHTLDRRITVTAWYGRCWDQWTFCCFLGLIFSPAWWLVR